MPAKAGNSIWCPLQECWSLPRYGHRHLGGGRFWLVSVLSLVSCCSTLQLGCGAPKPSITLSTTAPSDFMVRPGCSWHALQRSGQSLLMVLRWIRHKPGVNWLSGHLSNSISWSAWGSEGCAREILMDWINGLRTAAWGSTRRSARLCTWVTTTPCSATGWRSQFK